MSGAFGRLRGRRSVTWRTLLGLVLVPVTIAGVFLWGLWNPEDRLDTMTAAVVNLDKSVEVDGQIVPLGRVLAGELIGGDDDPDESFDWILTDEADAVNGLDDGRYTTVVTIPENFSAAATSLSKGPVEAEQANIDIATTDQGRLLDAALSGIVTQTAIGVLNEQLGSQFVGNVFVGFNELHTGIGDAADGAEQLADGGSQLADGADDLAEGTDGLVDGTAQLADGSGALASGAGDLALGAGALASGASEAATGAGSLAQGANDLAAGAATFAEGANTAVDGVNGFTSGVTQYTNGVGALAVGARQSATGSRQASDGVTEYVGTINEALGAIETGAAATVAPLTQLRDGVADGTVPPPPGFTQNEFLGLLNTALLQLGGASVAIGEVVSGGNDLVSGVSAAAAGSEGIANGVEQLALEGATLSAGGTELAQGVSALGTGASDLADGAAALAGGAGGLADGVSQLSSGTFGLAGGATELSGGAGQLAGGVSALAEGMPELADGAGQLADGTRKSAEGTSDLASGLTTARDDIPNYNKSERERLSELAVAPVKASGSDGELFNASGVPLFVGIALWAGGLAMFMVLSPLWRRTLEAARGIGEITLRSAIPSLTLGALQGALAGTVLPIALGYTLSQGFAFFAFSLVAGISLSLVVQGLSALLGGFGRFIAFGLLVVAFAVGIVSTVPGPLRALGDASPLGAALRGFQSIAMENAGAGQAMFVLVVWGLAGLALIAFGVTRARRTQPVDG